MGYWDYMLDPPEANHKADHQRDEPDIDDEDWRDEPQQDCDYVQSNAYGKG